jgi:hypothetical protein
VGLWVVGVVCGVFELWVVWLRCVVVCGGCRVAVCGWGVCVCGCVMFGALMGRYGVWGWCIRVAGVCVWMVWGMVDVVCGVVCGNLWGGWSLGCVRMG